MKYLSIILLALLVSCSNRDKGVPIVKDKYISEYSEYKKTEWEYSYFTNSVLPEDYLIRDNIDTIIVFNHYYNDGSRSKDIKLYVPIKVYNLYEIGDTLMFIDRDWLDDKNNQKD